MKSLKTTEKIKNELVRLDSRLAFLTEKHGDIEISLAGNYFESLASSIVGQQLSNKVTEVIWNRLVKLTGNGTTDGAPNTIKTPANYKQDIEYQVTPEAILKESAESLRTSGLSVNKIAYLKNLSQAVTDGSLDLDGLQSLDNEEIIARLTKIKGIGRWTAEMFLIFSLGRQDVYSLGDGGLYNAVRKLYGLEKPTAKELKELTDKWSPYRTFASLYLWKSLDDV